MYAHGNPSQGGGTYRWPPEVPVWDAPNIPQVTILPWPNPARREHGGLFDFGKALTLMRAGVVVRRAHQYETFRIIEGRLYSRRDDSSELVHLHTLQTTHILATDWHTA